MAFTPHSLISYIGNWVPSDMTGEVWQFGIRVSTGAPHGYYVSNAQAYADAIAAGTLAAFVNASNMFWNQARLTQIKVANIKADGTYNGVAGVHNFTSANIGGGTTTSPAPAFCSLAVTLETDGTTKRAKRGRVYPPFSLLTSNSALVTATAGQQTTAVTSVKALLNVINTTPDAAGFLVSPIIASRVDGTTSFITGLTCNNVFDVQRRRKNKIKGSRTAVVAFP